MDKGRRVSQTPCERLLSSPDKNTNLEVVRADLVVEILNQDARGRPAGDCGGASGRPAALASVRAVEVVLPRVVDSIRGRALDERNRQRRSTSVG